MTILLLGNMLRSIGSIDSSVTTVGLDLAVPGVLAQRGSSAQAVRQKQIARKASNVVF